FEHWPPCGHLVDFDAVKLAQLVQRRLVERPLVALEIECGNHRNHGVRIAAQRMDQFDPDIEVAVLLDPLAVFGMQGMPLIAQRIETECLGAHVTATTAGARRTATPRGRSRGPGTRPWSPVPGRSRGRRCARSARPAS